MPFYESVMIARPDISTAQMDTLAESMATIIKENGGEVKKTEYWGLRNLAYRIKKNRKGHYSLMNIDAPPAAVQEMERNMRISEDVLRYLTVRVDELDEEQSIIMQNRGSRDDRGGRGGRGGRDDRGGRGGRDDRGGGDRERRAAPAADAKPQEAKPEEAKTQDDAPAAEAKADGGEE